jgi:hypothetical protein
VSIPAFCTCTFVPAFVPNWTVVIPVTKFVSVTVTIVPPTSGPDDGLTPVTVGLAAVTYVNRSASVGVDVTPLTVTVTWTAAGVPLGGLGTEIKLGLVNVTGDAGTVPNMTVAVLVKWLPMIITVVPPARGPMFGEILVTVGAVAPT